MLIKRPSSCCFVSSTVLYIDWCGALMLFNANEELSYFISCFIVLTLILSFVICLMVHLIRY